MALLRRHVVVPVAAVGAVAGVLSTAPAAAAVAVESAQASSATGLESQLQAESPLQAEGWGQVVGLVSSAEGIGLAGVSVRVVGRDIGAITDRFGRYSLRRVPQGAQVLMVQALGFAEARREVTIEAGGTQRVDLQLTEAAVDLAPLKVVAERTRLVGDPSRLGDITGAAHLLTAVEMERLPNAFGDVHTALRTLPGVYVQDEDGYGLRPNIGLRGTGVERSGRITLMEDGVLIAPAPYAAPAAYYFPVAARMEAIEVRKGSSQIKYGPRTIGGALNLVSAGIPDAFRWSADLAGGDDQTFRGRARVGGTHGRIGWLVETFQIGTDGFKQLPGGGDTGFRVQDYVARLRWSSVSEASLPQSLELKVGYNDEISDETYLGLTDGDFAVAPLSRYAGSANDVMDAEQNQLQLRHILALPWGFDVTTTAYRNHFKRNWYKLQSVNGTSIGGVLSAPGAHPEAMAILQGADSEADALYLRANNRAYESMGLETLVGWRGDGLGMAHSLEAGLRLHRDDEDRLQWEDGFRMRGGRMERTSQGAPGSQANRLAAARATSLFMQDQISVGRLTVSPGIRFESVDFTRTDWSGDDPSRGMPTRVRENSVSAWIPGVGAAFHVNAATHLFGGVHRGFAPPGAGVDPATRPERSVNYEAGVRYRERGMALTTTAFYSDYDNILGQGTLAVGEEGIGEQFNGGRVEISGIELEVDVDPLWGRATAARLPLRVSYTFTQAEFASSFDSEFEPWGSVQAGDRLPYLPSHQFAASAGLERGALSFDANVFGNSAMRTVAGQGAGTVDERTDAFAIVNLSADYELAQGGSVYVGLQNVLDQRYITARRPAGTRPGLPRTLMVGYRIGG